MQHSPTLHNAASAVPVLGLFCRWNWLQTVAASLAYMAAVGVLLRLASTGEHGPSVTILWLLSNITPLLIALGLAASGQLRAIGPYLVPLFLVLVLASIAGTDVLWGLMDDERGAAWIEVLLGFVSPYTVFGAAALMPCLLMAGPAWLMARGLAAAYRARRFSDFLYLAGGYWLVALAMEAITASHSVGAFSVTVLASWLWLPVGTRLLAKWAKAPADPPHLLVLRVFQRDREMRGLFAKVIDRWRYSGRTSLIAGTDLVLDALEPDELFAFLGGRLADRYITDDRNLAARLAELGQPPDRDGRYRVTEFFCYDTTWQQVSTPLEYSREVPDEKSLVGGYR